MLLVVSMHARASKIRRAFVHGRLRSAEGSLLALRKLLRQRQLLKAASCI